MTTYDRRREILYYLNIHRKTTYGELADYFEVSFDTIRRDILALDGECPVITTAGKHGGISVMDDWHVEKKFLTRVQEDLLKRLCRELNGEDLETMEGILKTFGRNPSM